MIRQRPPRLRLRLPRPAAAAAFAAALAAALAPAVPAGAETWVAGTGLALYPRRNAGAVSVERHSAPLWRLGPVAIGIGLAVQADGAGGAWLGAGPVATWPIGARWFVEASVMPGIHAATAGRSRLGGWLHFRSLIGLGYRLGEATSLSLAVDHRSNANLFRINPGEETLNLRLRLGF